ncbi:hypothetical protein PC128_g25676 [Phytophthora cactorum]|nr:hypothetical protein PC120_g25340 [Phytophthora cactorum]KAG3052586.1 hypothetical protein PC121_g17228 [Phytophthora cactorum]KAG3137811.1 hypothetical protein PC128_g25676 [Phytophthora cactorum]
MERIGSSVCEAGQQCITKEVRAATRQFGRFKSQLEVIWHKARLRNHGYAAFGLQLFVYIPQSRVQRLTSLRRATDARIQGQLPRVGKYMRERQIEGGAATTRYAAIRQARLPENAPTSVPDNVTFRQLHFIDRQASDMETAQHQQQAADEYWLVRACMHGVVVPLFLNVSDLRDTLELPAYRLRPPIREPRDLGTPDPAQDMDDEDMQIQRRTTSALLEKLQRG